jgi:tetratricopeptide (TPR) repeat protein
MKPALLFVAALPLFVQQMAVQPMPAQQKAADNCAPPPSALAPTLPARLLTGMGAVHMPMTTTSAEAQKFFDQGVAQMHSFWAREAERSFLEAAALDPSAPMPYWGIAMVAAGDWRPRFQIDLLERVQGKRVPPATSRARAAAQRAVELAQIPGKATDLEKLYIAAVAARRDPNAKDAPEEAFVKGMRTLLAAYPDEVEAQLDLALVIMRGFSLPDKKPIAPGSTEAVAILRALLPKIPDHPAVHHYVIHGFEGATFARDAWPSCEKYAQLVTNIPHALHMPGHIYSQTGRWADAAKAFSDAAVSERRWMSQDKLYGSGHHGHNVHYLATAYSFEGRYDDAIEAAKELLGYPENPAQAAQPDAMTTARAQGFFAMLRTLVQFEKWDAILAGDLLPEFGKPRQDAWRHWARALAYANQGNPANAKEESRLFEQSMTDFRARTHLTDPPELQVARQELTGHLELAGGHIARALKQLEQASKSERRLTYTEPPYYPRPVAEAMGHAAEKNNRPAVAARAFRTALAQYPADSHAAQGLKSALIPSTPKLAGYPP